MWFNLDMITDTILECNIINLQNDLMIFVFLIGLYIDVLQFEIQTIWMDKVFLFHLYIAFISSSFFVFFLIQNCSYFQCWKIMWYQNLKTQEWKFSTSWEWRLLKLKKTIKYCQCLRDSIIDCESELMSKVVGMRADQSFMIKCIIIGTSHKMVYDQIISCKARKVFKNIVFYCFGSHRWLHVCDLMKIKFLNDWYQKVIVFYVSYCI